MDTFTVTATELKNNPSEIINRVHYEKQTAFIKRYGKIIARMTPEINDKPKESFNEIWDRYAGAIPGISDVKKFRTLNTHRFKLKI
ncbi:hypothetical protein HY947_05650 [Candidatus Gottesmanbacteria bacterium]|nr:hypothetical protein [Candidatus Gottesmanbacteria bacterium]